MERGKIATLCNTREYAGTSKKGGVTPRDTSTIYYQASINPNRIRVVKAYRGWVLVVGAPNILLLPDYYRLPGTNYVRKYKQRFIRVLMDKGCLCFRTGW